MGQEQTVTSNDSRKFFISEVLGHKVYDSEGLKVGKLQDLLAIWVSVHPQVTALKLESRDAVLPLQLVAGFDAEEIRLQQPFDPALLRPADKDEIHVSRWLLDKQIVDVRGAKVERVNDILLWWHHIEGKPRISLMEVEIGLRGILRRLGFKFLAPKAPERLLNWDRFKPLATRTANLEMALPLEYVSRMHPADIADILQELHPEGQMQVLNALSPETAGVTLAEVDANPRRQLLAALDAEQALDLILAMDPDDAADNLKSLPADMQAAILDLIEPEKAQLLARLMHFEEGTAGSLMTPKVISFRQDGSVRDLWQWLQEEQPDFTTWNEVFVVDEGQKLVGMVPLRTLILAHTHTRLGDLMETPLSLNVKDDFGKILDFSVKYDLLALPVVDENQHLLGMVTLDDVLSSLVQNPRNRRYLPRRSPLSSFRKRTGR